jgi:type I restriction enzyme S subunit
MTKVRNQSSSWSQSVFSDLFLSPPRNGIYKSKEYQGRGVSIVKMNELFSRRVIDPSNMDFDRLELSENEKSKLLLQQGDLLFSRTSVVAQGVGKCSIVRITHGDLTFDSNIFRIRLDQSKADPHFYFYYFNSPDGRSQVLSLASGAAVTTISGLKLSTLKVPHPSLLVQSRIASVVSAYDGLIENNTRRIKILEEMAEALYREWFVHFRFPVSEKVKLIDGDLPRGWELKKLGDVSDIVMGQSPRSEFYNETGEGLPFHQGVTNFGDRFPVDRIYCTVENRIAQEGDILFSVRAPVGRLNIADKKIIIGRGLCAVRSKTDNQPFVFQQLTEKFREEDTMGGGTIFKSVTRDDMHGIEMLWPDETTLAQFDQCVKPIFRELENLTSKNANLRRTRDLLLPKLISGEANMEE